MGVIEDVVINAKSAATTVGKEAGRLVDISKLRFSAAELQKEINKRFESLGRMTYDCRKSGSSADMNFDEQIEYIDRLYVKLDDTNDKINALRKKTACPSCGYCNEENAVFCSRCGHRFVRDRQQTDFQADEDVSGDGE